ncbi:MAG: hypothetical protein ABW208_06795 [Pyrinomonadaceae bacterium]
MKKMTTLTLTLICLATLTALVVFAQSKRKKKQEPVVIGAEAKEAAEAEARRQAAGNTGKSPMPAGEYKFSREELGLINPKPNEFDAALADLSRRYAQSDAPERARWRRSISMDEFYTLLEFAKRVAVFGLRERSAARLADGLSAVAMVEQERVDYRDILVTLSLLHHSAARIGESPGKLFADAAALAEPGTAKLIRDFLKRPAKEKDLRASWGYDEVETEGGGGFIGWGFEKYEPTYDLKKVAVDVARLVANDKYENVSASVADEMARHWLETDDNAALDRALRSARAGATVHASHRGGAQTGMPTQVLMVFLVEASSEADARALLEIAGRKKSPDDGVLALAEGRLFCLLVARAGFMSSKNEETNESVRRFSAGLAEILHRHVKG